MHIDSGNNENDKIISLLNENTEPAIHHNYFETELHYCSDSALEENVVIFYTKSEGIFKSFSAVNEFLRSSRHPVKSKIVQKYLSFYREALLLKEESKIHSVINKVKQTIIDEKILSKLSDKTVNFDFLVCKNEMIDEKNEIIRKISGNNYNDTRCIEEILDNNHVMSVKIEEGKIEKLQQLASEIISQIFDYRGVNRFKEINVFKSTPSRFIMAASNEYIREAFVVVSLMTKEIIKLFQEEIMRLSSHHLNIDDETNIKYLDFASVVNKYQSQGINGKEYKIALKMKDIYKSKAYKYKYGELIKTGRVQNIIESDSEYLVQFKDVTTKELNTVSAASIISENKNIKVYNTINAKQNKAKTTEAHKIELKQRHGMKDLFRQIYFDAPENLIKENILFKVSFESINNAYALFFHKNGAREEMPLLMILGPDQRTVIGLFPMTAIKPAYARNCLKEARDEAYRELNAKNDFNAISYVNDMYNHINSGKTVSHIHGAPLVENNHISCTYKMQSYKTSEKHEIIIEGQRTSLKLNIKAAYKYQGETDFEWFNWNVIDGLSQLEFYLNSSFNDYERHVINNLFKDFKYFQLPANGTFLYGDMLGGACKDGSIGTLCSLNMNTSDGILLPVPVFYGMFLFLYFFNEPGGIEFYLEILEDLAKVGKGRLDISEIPRSSIRNSICNSMRTGQYVPMSDGLRQFVIRYANNFTSSLRLKSKSGNTAFSTEYGDIKRKITTNIGSDFIKLAPLFDKRKDSIHLAPCEKTVNEKVKIERKFVVPSFLIRTSYYSATEYLNYARKNPITATAYSTTTAFFNLEDNVISPKNRIGKINTMLAMYPQYKDASEEELKNMLVDHLKIVGKRLRNNFEWLDNHLFFNDYFSAKEIGDGNYIHVDNAKMLKILMQ